MTDARLLRIAVLVLLSMVAAAGCAPAPQAASGYEDEILASRAEKDRLFRESAESPVPPERRAAMLPMRYFPPDPDYRVPAVLRVSADRPVFVVPTSTGQTRSMRRVGVLEFTVKGQPLKLSALVEADDRSVNRLFVPFTDLTSGTETYPGGRYLDLDRTATGLYDLDFNRAFNPYCYYDERFDCPYPPPENRLKVPIRAGERLPLS